MFFVASLLFLSQQRRIENQLVTHGRPRNSRDQSRSFVLLKYLLVVELLNMYKGTRRQVAEGVS